jgi:hypothetical protein
MSLQFHKINNFKQNNYCSIYGAKQNFMCLFSNVAEDNLKMNDLWKKTIWSKISWCIWQALHISNPYSSKTNQQQQKQQRRRRETERVFLFYCAAEQTLSSKFYYNWKSCFAFIQRTFRCSGHLVKVWQIWKCSL